MTNLRSSPGQRGAEVAGRLIQSRESIHPGTYIGKGQAAGAQGSSVGRQMQQGSSATTSSPAPSSEAWSRSCPCKVIDRTLLILDIFAARGSLRGGKDPGGAGTAPLQGVKADGAWKIPVPAWEAVSAQEARERRSWRWTGVLSGRGSAA